MSLSSKLMRGATNISNNLPVHGVSLRTPMPQFQNGILFSNIVTQHQMPYLHHNNHRMHNTKSKVLDNVLVSKVETLKVPTENVSGIEHDHTHDEEEMEEEEGMEQEEMFVQPHTSLGHELLEWGGPTRGGRLSEPTRFGDWERKGRCTDF